MPSFSTEEVKIILNDFKLTFRRACDGSKTTRKAENSKKQTKQKTKQTNDITMIPMPSL